MTKREVALTGQVKANREDAEALWASVRESQLDGEEIPYAY